MAQIIGRQKEIEKLDSACGKNGAQLIVVYGRRRIGKTFLIDNYFGNNFSFKLTGVHKLSRSGQLKNFFAEMIRKGYEPEKEIKDWSDAFDCLRAYLDSRPGQEKQVVFFDEMPWLDSPKSGFKEAFEYFWNDYGIAKDNLIFVACGSASSWVRRFLIGNKGGLFNRFTQNLYLEPFNLFETEQYLRSMSIHWSRYDVVQCYMIMGGIPYYLRFLDGKKTLAENVDAMFFERNCILRDEFDRLYATLFSDQEIYKKAVETLCRKPYGMTRDEIAADMKVPNNGKLSKVLDDLIASGFAQKRTRNGRRKEVIYLLTDYYTRFYLRFVKGCAGTDERYWTNSYSDASRTAWCGVSFEQLCFSHVRQIKNALGIGGVLSEEYAYLYRSGSTDDHGAQIDLVLDRKDRTCSLCEIKFASGEFRLDREEMLNLLNKAEVFRNQTGTTKSIQLVLITTFGLKRNEYSGQINRALTMDDLFNNGWQEN